MRIVPRGTLDIGWLDLLYGLLFCFWPGPRLTAQKKTEASWSTDRRSLSCLSVRSGFDLVLGALALPKGSEILVTAVNIRDMFTIVEQHGLVAIPLDVDSETLSVDAESVEKGITPKTRAILIAHLFGSRMDMESIARVSQRHRLFVFEDCAQAYDGSSYRGHSESDVAMFSFGPIKTATALGGALLCFKNDALLEVVRNQQATYPVQPRRDYLRRIVRFAGLKFLATPFSFGIFVKFCRMRGTSHDQILRNALRGFSNSELFSRIRRQPSLPCLKLLRRRVTEKPLPSVQLRITVAQRLKAALNGNTMVGDNAEHHSHWVVPIQSRDPEGLVRKLLTYGFDATRYGSSLVTVPTKGEAFTPTTVAKLLEKIVYLPIYPKIKMAEINRLSQMILEFEHPPLLSSEFGMSKP